MPAAVVAILLGAANAAPAQTFTFGELYTWLGDAQTYSDSTILKRLRDSCVSFVPTRGRLRDLRDRRPLMSAALYAGISRPCFSQLDIRDAEEIGALLDDRGDSIIFFLSDWLRTCPANMTERRLRALRRDGLGRDALVLVAEKCGIDHQGPRLQLALEPFMKSPLLARGALRDEGMDFQGKSTRAGSVAYRWVDQVQAGIHFSQTSHALDSAGFDVAAGGQFTMRQYGASVRWFPRCLLQGMCASYLTADWDPFLQFGAARTVMKGAVTGDGAAPTHMVIDGWEYALRGGVLWHLHPRASVGPVLGIAAIDFETLSKRIASFRNDDSITGLSWRPQYGLTLMVHR